LFVSFHPPAPKSIFPKEKTEKKKAATEWRRRRGEL